MLDHKVNRILCIIYKKQNRKEVMMMSMNQFFPKLIFIHLKVVQLLKEDRGIVICMQFYIKHKKLLTSDTFKINKIMMNLNNFYIKKTTKKYLETQKEMSLLKVMIQLVYFLNTKNLVKQIITKIIFLRVETNLRNHVNQSKQTQIYFLKIRLRQILN